MTRFVWVMWLPTVACDSGSNSHTGACSTDEWWEGGDEESPLMHPGSDCIGCHAESGEGPEYTVAGTVMGDYADADDCYGVEGVTVSITDANGVRHDVTTNAAGNFFLSERVPSPYTIDLEFEGRTRSMVAAQTDGSCAICHTATGANSAPGRTIAP
jgi:hypothetical protein